MIKLKFYHHLKTLLAITVLLMISATTAQAQKVTQKGILKLNSYKTEDFSYYGITGPITQSDELYSKGVIYFDFMSGTDEYLAFEDFRQFTRSGKLRLPSSIASDFKFSRSILKKRPYREPIIPVPPTSPIPLKCIMMNW